MEELSMEEYCVKIDELVLDLLVPARTEKKINIPVFEKFYGLLTELENKLRGEEYIPRKLAGLLYFIYKSLSAEAEHCSMKMSYSVRRQNWEIWLIRYYGILLLNIRAVLSEYDKQNHIPMSTNQYFKELDNFFFFSRLIAEGTV